MSRRSERLPVEVDPFRLAQTGRKLEGHLPLKQMKRLKPLLTSDAGEVQLELEFGIDSMGIHFLTGRITASLEMICQRCLEAMPLQANLRLDLAFVHDASDAEAIPGPYEPYVVESTPVMLIDMIEDELLLFLPSIPKHELTDCPARDWVENEEPQARVEDEIQTEPLNENPFSVLESLKTPNKGK